MKSIIVGILVLLAGAQAEARSVRRYLGAELNQFQMQPNGSIGNHGIDSGGIRIDFFDREATLTLQPSFYCPPNAACALVMPHARVVTLPLTSVTTGHCQERIYTASKDLRPVDGPGKTLTIIDNSTNVCRYFVEIAKTEVRYRVQSVNFITGEQIDELHVMTGNRLN